MSSIERFDEQSLQVATDWWLRLREVAVADETLQQWLLWVEGDSRHLDLFERVNALANQLGSLDDEARRSLVREFATPTRTTRPWLSWAAAAGLMAVIWGGYLAWSIATHDRVTQDYASAIAQHRNIRLPDGTEMALGGASHVAVRFTGRERQVDLAEGEAFFQVAHDAKKPFIVTAGRLAIHDVGTAFDVRHTGQRVTIVVTEGRVRVDSGRGATAMIEAKAGQRVVYDPTTSTLGVDQVLPGEAVAWRENRIAFDNEPLSAVVTNLNRYSARPIRIADPGLENLGFTGTINTNAIDRWLNTLPQVLPVRVTTRSDEIVLSHAVRDVRQ
ncbi:FecR family protein [Dyella koreensis]|uniref:FecR domain-containing protein n=1 Tax=Dyella koreensis TaxID=311235 RepID=A0ABW8K7X2_9GAMM